MRLAFSPTGLDRIKSANPIEQVIGERTALRKKGQVLVGRCLFHRPDKTPSLTVYPQEGRFHCFGSGCDADGDVIGFVMKADGLSFPEGVRRLCDRASIPVKEVLEKDAAGKTPAPRRASRRAPVIPRAAVDAGSGDDGGKPPSAAQVSALAHAVEHWQRCFIDSPRAQEYATSRGFTDPDLLMALKVGYSDGSLVKLVPGRSELRDALSELGVITRAGKELLGGCLVVPLMDPATGAWTNVYGRGVRTDRHCYLPGPPRGVFNPQAARANDEVVLTESILDALSFLQAGISSVVALHGTNGLHEAHVDLLKRERVRRVVLALDNDEAGRKAAEVLGERLEALGLAVRVARLPEGIKDPNELLVSRNGDATDAFMRILADAEPRRTVASVVVPVPPAEPSSSGAPATSTVTQVDATPQPGPPALPVHAPVSGEHSQLHGARRQGDEVTLTRGALSFQARVYPPLVGRLRATIRAARGVSFHVDTIDLLLSKSRTDFARRAVKALGLDAAEAERIEADLLAVLVEAEKVTNEVHAAASDEPPAMTEAERADALALLRRKDLLDQVARDAWALGFVGEERSVKLLFLVAVSSRSSQPFSAVILSQSGAGKSVITELVEQMMPPEFVVLFTRLTPQSLSYIEPGFLDRKLVIIEERHGSQEADYSIRVLQSRGKLITAAPVKDPATGNLKTRVIEVVAKAAFIEATTASEVNHENATRCFELTMDESVEQTRRIHERQRFLKTEAGLEQRRQMEPIRRRWWNAIRLLEPLSAVIPFADRIEFPVSWMRTRRDHARFLNLIEVSAFLHQYQRERRNGAIVASIDDYAVAYELAREVLAETLSEMKRPLRDTFERVRDLVEQTGAPVSRRQVREAVQLPDSTVRRRLAELLELEYLDTDGGGGKSQQGRTVRYRPADGDPRREPLVGLLTPDELARRLR